MAASSASVSAPQSASSPPSAQVSMTGTGSGTLAWQYDLPADALRLLPLTYDNERAGVPISWEIRDGKLHSDQESPRKVRYIANLTDPDESDNAVREKIEAGVAQVEATPQAIEAKREIWRWLAITAVVLLLAEWWVYHRRIGL